MQATTSGPLLALLLAVGATTSQANDQSPELAPTQEAVSACMLFGMETIKGKTDAYEAARKDAIAYMDRGEIAKSTCGEMFNFGSTQQTLLNQGMR